MIDLEDKIATLCYNKFDSLKKTGKPTEKEWTVLSGVVLQNTMQEFSVLSLCTGTKCLSGLELTNINRGELGTRLSDSHAEILAKRAFQRYLYYQIELILNDKQSDVFFMKDGKIKLKDVYFHFFSSQTPCGDCSIIPKIRESNDVETLSKKIKLDNNELDFGLEITDIHRTGAKCLQHDDKQDSFGSGIDYHVVGPLRTKPGRGDRTLSLSCSDKIAKWMIAVGVQGALLSLMIPQIKFKSIIIGGGVPYSLESMQRGLFTRFSYKIETSIIIRQSKFAFDQRKSNTRTRPCASSIIWCSVTEKSFEVAVNGYKQGTTKNKNKNYLTISRIEIFKKFLKIYNVYSCMEKLSQHPKKINYRHCKQFAINYQNNWNDKRRKFFPTWPVKDLYLQEF